MSSHPCCCTFIAARQPTQERSRGVCQPAALRRQTKLTTIEREIKRHDPEGLIYVLISKFAISSPRNCSGKGPAEYDKGSKTTSADLLTVRNEVFPLSLLTLPHRTLWLDAFCQERAEEDIHQLVSDSGGIIVWLLAKCVFWSDWSLSL